MSSQEIQDMPRTTRRSLRTLQHTANDRENLVGRPSKNLKHQLSQDSIIDVEVKRKNLSTKETQANLDSKISAKDLTDPKGASEKYWQILAEKRQIALQEALGENEELRNVVKELNKEIALYKQMLEEANSFVEVIKEELGNNSNDDTGIDVNDVSQSDATENEGPNTTDSIDNVSQCDATEDEGPNTTDSIDNKK